jgi:AcrR family transcriptional regulator
MTSTLGQHARRLRPEKRRAVLDAARAVFARDGYARASVEAIAAEAAVSTRTLYNHFPSKEVLFSVVLHESAKQVADAFCDQVARELRGEDLRSDLVSLGRALVAHRVDFPEHFAMVRQLNAEATHFPRELLDEWLDSGPRRVEREVETRLARLSDRGLLRIGERRRAAIHFIALTQAELTTRPYAGDRAPTRRQLHKMVNAGVDAFLHGYAMS